MNRWLLVALMQPAFAHAQQPIEYEVSFDNAVHHEARISVTWREIAAHTLQARMSRSSPGRYALHEFGKNVYDVRATDGAGRPLEITRPDPYQWDVAGHDGIVTIAYTLYADALDGTYAAIDVTHAHLNMPATFMWARGFDERPITVRFVRPLEGWQVATQLAPTADPYVFTAPSLQYFLDSPTELSAHASRSWQVTSGGRTQTIRLAVHHGGTDDDVDALVSKAKKVVDAHIRMFGELPAFDFGEYTFIADYLNYAVGDGMEHRNSTILTSPEPLVKGDAEHLGDLSHEFTHAWNVERIRPVGLEPFDFERANMSDNLWFAEGFTSYYGPLAVLRAGESELDDFAEALSAFVNLVTNARGRNFASPRGMSTFAPFVDAATAVDPTNFANTFISYYPYGAALALALDLEIRSEFEDSTLDSLMREMWQTYGKREKPYTGDNLHAALAAVTSQAFADEFFASYIDAAGLPDYAALLGKAGLVLRKAHPGKAWLGPASLEFEGKDAILDANTIIGTPLYDAGLDRGDEIIAIGRLKIDDADDWDGVLERYKPGDKVAVRYLQRDIERAAEVTFVEDSTVEVVTLEKTGRGLTRAQRAFRAAWLGDRID